MTHPLDTEDDFDAQWDYQKRRAEKQRVSAAYHADLLRDELTRAADIEREKLSRAAETNRGTPK